MSQQRNTILICCLIACAFAIFSFNNETHIKHTIYTGLPEHSHSQTKLPATGKHFTIELSPDDAQRITSIDIIFSGSANFHVGEQAIEPACNFEQSHQKCRIILSHGNSSHHIYLDALGDNLTLNEINLTVLKESRLTGASYKDLFLIWIGIAIMLPIIWLTHNNRVVSQWLLILLSTSIIFYIQPEFSVVLIAYLIASYYIGTKLSKGSTKLLWIYFISAIFILVFFKYVGDDIIGIFLDPGDFGLLLPLGLSYFIIRAIDTQVNWYRGLQHDVSIREYLCFIIFPATLPAGPIDTLSHFREARVEKITKQDVLYGVSRILIGLFKKIVIADFLVFQMLYGEAGIFSEIMSSSEIEPSIEIILLLSGSFIFVYLDFSAYSDIAIGLARCMGYRVPENFNLPILATSIRDYWKRWHISLSNWCMRNIYMPLLITTHNAILPAYMVMLAVGMWHSFTASWFLWAVHHGSAIAIQGSMERRLKNKAINILPKKIKRILAIMFVFFWVSAGHAFAQIHDPHVAIELYLAYWVSFFNV